MNTNEDKKAVVKEKYAEIARSAGSSSCCGPTSCCSSDVDQYTVFQDDYSQMKGYVRDADLGLGCGIPTEHAGIKEGDTVVDLGSGAGNDVFVARAIAGETSRVIGIDMTEEMLDKANRNNEKLGYKNVEFKLGDIEAMPLENEIADVVVSNCVLNLVPDKEKAFAEIYRVLKPGAHFCVSDIVIEGELNEALRKSAEMYAGCVSGAIKKEEYLAIVEKAGFKNIEIKKITKNSLPDELIEKYLSGEALKQYHENLQGIFSITVVGYKN